MTVVAYMRVSTDSKGQTTDNQKKMVSDAGFAVDVWYSEEGVSGTVKALDRPKFKEMMMSLQSGDVCIVTMVDRLGRTASDVLHTVEEFKRIGVKLRVMQFDGMDITSAMGKMVLTCMAAMAELEAGVLRERTMAGLARTREAGTIFGTSKAILPEVQEEIYHIRKATNMPFAKLAEKYGSNAMTMHRCVKLHPAEYAKDYYAREQQHASNFEKRGRI